MSANQLLSATIRSASLREPDSDGDTRLEGSLVLSSASDECLELFITKQLLRGADGAVLSASTDEREDALDSGDELQLDLDSGYLKASLLNGTPNPLLQVQVLGCTSNYIQLKPVQLGDGTPGLYGWHQPTQTGSSVIIESLAVSVGTVDDDGDVRFEIRALVHNQSDQYVPRIAVKARAMATGGREIDSSSTEEKLRPSETKVIELCFYSIKQNRLRGLAISTEATVFASSSSARCESEIEASQL